MNTEEKRQAIRDLIFANPNQVFSVTYVKKNNEQRKLVCRRGVKKYLKGGKSTTEHVPNLLNAWEMKVGGEYRSINLDTVTRLAVNKQVYTF